MAPNGGCAMNIRKAGMVAALVLALGPAVALPQMGRGPGMGQGMPGAAAPGTRPVVAPEQEKPGEPQGQPPPEATQLEKRHEITGEPMEHPAPPVPFYRERTFLILLGVVSSAAGLAAYRVLRSRRRQRRGAAGFLTEAVLVVDLVDSTHLATHYGDGLAMRARNLLKDRALAEADRHGVAFVESTGDGCLITFPSVSGAVRTAIGLLRDLRDRPPDLSPGPPLAVRAGISYGEILLDARGARHGAVINRAFRLEGLGRENFVPVEGGGDPAKIPETNRILLSEEAAREAQDAGVPLRSVGFCTLKGFSGLHRVYAVLWEDQG
jgi:class 3 adenylate cyclase